MKEKSSYQVWERGGVRMPEGRQGNFFTTRVSMARYVQLIGRGWKWGRRSWHINFLKKRAWRQARVVL